MIKPMARLSFPPDFLWGSATSAYQIEGGLEKCDWAKVYPAGAATDHYRRYKEDFQLLQALSQNSYRLSIEWSRVEQTQGVFDEDAIAYYRDMLKDLKSKDITVMVTLFHFTTPVWLSEQGGWSNKKSINAFADFAAKMHREFQDLVDLWITVNEPVNYVALGYITGRWVPRKRNPFAALLVFVYMIRAHKEAYQRMHRAQDDVRVGIAKGYTFVEPYKQSSFLDRMSVAVYQYVYNHLFLKKINKYLDFIGVNYYFHAKIRFPGVQKNENVITSDLGWEVYPEGIYHVLEDAQRYNVPLYVTENGLADEEDSKRKDFIKEHIRWIHKAVSEGVDVKGYFHWSLLDNFEWERGFAPRFGLIAVDYDTYQRTPRPSAHYYATICKDNALEV